MHYSSMPLDVTGLIIASLVLVAGMAWNNAVEAGIKEYGPNIPGTEFRWKVIYAIAITIVVGMMIYGLEYFGFSVKS